MKSIGQFLLTLLLTIALLIVVFRKAELEHLAVYGGKARPVPLLASLVLSFITNCWLATSRWKFMLRCFGLPLSFREAFRLKMGGGPLKNALPFRSGEAGRVVYLKRKYGFPFAKGTASIILELLTNVVVLIAFILLLGGMMRFNPGGLLWILFLAPALLVAVILIVSRPPIKKWFKLLLNRIPFPRIRQGLLTLLTAHRHLRPPQVLAILAYSLVIQAGKFLSFLLITTSLNIAFPAGVYLVILPLSILIASVPITFLGLGLREYSLTELASRYYQIPAVTMLGPALLFSTVEYIFPALLGIFWTRKFVEGMIAKKEISPSG